jgi:phage gp29-like protein
MGELAGTDDALYLKGKIIPYNPDTLIGRKGFQMYDQMRIDDQVKACLTLKKFATLAPGFQIIPASNEDEDVEVADYVEYTLDKCMGNLSDYLLEIMTALDYGFSVTEINYRTYETGVHKGKIGLKNLKTKAPYYYKFAVDEYDNLLKDGLVYDKGGEDKRYPINKFIIFSYQKEFGNWFGTSDLRPAYRGYWSKDVLIKMWNIYLERFANPTVVGKYKSNDPTGKSNLRNILDNLTAKTSITHRMDEFDINFLESSRNATGDFNTALNFYNKAIARAILIPDRLMAEGDTGAYAQAKIHFDVFLWVIEKLRQDIADTVMNEQLIKRLVSYNYANVLELPKFKFNPLTDDQKLELNNMFVTAVEKGVIIPTLEDENILRTHLNFPEKDLNVDNAPKPVEDEVKEEVDIEVVEEEQVDNKQFAQVDLKPTKSMKVEADRGLAWRKEFNRGGTRVGVARANQLSNMETLSPSTVKRMFSYFSRHEVDKQGQGFNKGEKGYPSAGRIAWALWGGDAGFAWSRKKTEQLKPEADGLSQESPHKHYARTKMEKRVDFAQVDEALSNLDLKLEQNIKTVMKKQMEAANNYIVKKMETDKFDFTAIDNLDIRYKDELVKVMEKGYTDAYEEGKKQARQSLPNKFSTTRIGTGMVSTGFQRYFKSKARLDVKKITATLNNNLITTLLDSIVKGKSIPRTTMAIESAFAPYLADGETIKRTGALATSYRTNAIARTATLGAYNYGRRDVGEDKDVKDFVIGYQLSAVLDDRTSEICELVAEIEPTIRAQDEGMINELTPPLHYNCRTIMVFVTKDDTPIEWTDDGDLEEIISLSGMTE